MILAPICTGTTKPEMGHPVNVVTLEDEVANDTSGVDPAIDLTLSGDTDFIGGWGIRVGDGKAQASTTTSNKLYDTISITGEYSIEAWVAPSNVTQDDAYIVSYSGSNDLRNFTLGQTLWR